MNNEERARWHSKVVAVLKEGEELKIPATLIVGTFMGCVIATAQADGATAENIVQLARDCWPKSKSPSSGQPIWKRFKDDVFDAWMKVAAVGRDLQDAATAPRYDEEYKVEREPRITHEFLDELKVRVQALYDFAYSNNSPLQGP